MAKKVEMTYLNSSGTYETIYPKVDLSNITGTLPVANGGTGTTSLNSLMTNMGAARIQTGSYVGTGTYGASNPCSLTFNFKPIFFLMQYTSDQVKNSSGSMDYRFQPQYSHETDNNYCYFNTINLLNVGNQYVNIPFGCLYTESSGTYPNFTYKMYKSYARVVSNTFYWYVDQTRGSY